MDLAAQKILHSLHLQIARLDRYVARCTAQGRTVDLPYVWAELNQTQKAVRQFRISILEDEPVHYLGLLTKSP